MIKKGSSKMKTVTKLAMLLAVLAICMPAYGQGEVRILVYSKTIDCWDAWEVIDDGVDWQMDEDRTRGYLVLEVLYDAVTGEIVDVLDAEQIEYWREGRDRFYEPFEEEYTIERVDVGDEVIWVLEYLEADTEPDLYAQMLMVRGKTREMNIGFSRDRDDRREVARRLDGNILYLYMGEPIEKSMCSMSLRLHHRFTRLANDPDFGDSDFETTVIAIIDWLEDRGYEAMDGLVL
jgi:hypothetical protein